MKTKEKEVISSCCAFASDGSEEVHVKEDDCPINRQLGKGDGECTCIYRNCSSGFSSLGVPRCEFYDGTKLVTRNKRKVHKVLCRAVNNNTSE